MATPSIPTGAEAAHQSFKDSFSYSSYLRIEQLLGAQAPLTDAHDEVLFITIHHVQEVWMSLIIKEISGAMTKLTAGDFEPAMKMLARVSRAQEQMGAAWEVLKTMTPADYLEFRSAFGKASGFQSWQYRSIEFLLGNRQRYMLKPFAEQPEHLAQLTHIIDSPSLYDIALQALAKRGLLPASALFGAVPFGMESVEFMAWMYFGGGNELLRELFKPHNVVPIFCGTISPEAAGWFRQEITSPDQLKGLKFRAAGLGGKVYQKVGSSVTLLPAGELFQALEKGVLDGTEFSLPSVDDQLGFYKVAKFYMLPGWHQPSTNQYLYINSAVWDKLNATTKAQIETTCTAAVTAAQVPP